MKRNTDEVLESPAKNIYHKNTGIQTEQPCKKDLVIDKYFFMYSATIIQGRQLFKGGNYSRKYGR